MNQDILSSVKKPPLYAKSKAAFWNDPYISGQMLKAHLDPEFDGASRKLRFIEQSVAWIQGEVPPSRYPLLLDAGCGPGLYAERFARAGYRVTGVDLSERSIRYARQSALERGLDISYVHQNYLELELGVAFDFATMIYCDYGALSDRDRQTLLLKLYRHLRPGGKLLLDVFSLAKYQNFQERQTWEMSEKRGFWREGPYLALNGYYRYPGNVTLDLVSVLSKDGASAYYLWNTYFSEESLIREAESAGFQARGVWADVAGQEFQPESDTIAILLERP